MRRKIHGDEGDVRTEKCQGRLTVYFEESFASGDFYNRQTQDAEHLATIVLLSRAWGETTE